MSFAPENSPSTEPGAEHLRRALQQLPAHEPAPATWARIETQLVAEAALPRLVAELPTHEPPGDLWAGIASRLDEAAERDSRPQTVAAARYATWWLAPAARRARALAASLLLILLGAGWWQLSRPVPVARTAAGPHETLTVSEETVDAAPLPTLPADVLETQGLAFIKKGCARQPLVCNSNEFQSLTTQLMELKTQQQELQQATHRFGSSPELAREQTRLVNLQATVTRQLINLLIS